MGVMTSLYTGVSGLGASGLALSVIGDNIANTNTTGFKGSRAAFGDILSSALGGGSAFQIGRGVNLQAVQQQFTQGTLETTASPLDLAVEGDGFFIVKESSGAQYYTRAGQFSLDKNGNIVNPEGIALQGYLTLQGGVLGTINISSLNSPPQATGSITGQPGVNISANLSSSATITAAPANEAAFLANPNNFSNFSTSLTVYDSLGNSHLINVYFRKSAENVALSAPYAAVNGNVWEWFAVSPGSDNASGNSEIGAYGQVEFDSSGKLRQEFTAGVGAAGSTAYSFAPAVTPGVFSFSGGAAANQSIEFNYGDSIAEGGSGLTGSTQFGSPSSVLFQNQDGYSSGSLQSLIVDQNGSMTGIFTNGQTQKVADIALARFISATSLTKTGRNLFSESSNSGGPIIGTAGTSGRGRIFANSLEASNVDLADEFVKMIAAQRGFQANTKVITTTDELLTELMNIKR